MSVQLATNALATVLESVTTNPTFRVFRIPPTSLTSADLPAAVLMHRGGEFTWHATRLARKQYTFDIVLLIDTAAQQRTTERVQTAQILYDAVVDALLNAPTLNAAIDHVMSIQDNAGYSVMTWSNAEYFCYTLSVTLVIKTTM